MLQRSSGEGEEGMGVGPRANGKPVPLFIDVDGGLCAVPLQGDVVGPGLQRVELKTTPPYPSHAWVNPAAVIALNELIDAALVQPIWCTTWDDAANHLIPALGLHGGAWPVATLGTRRGESMWQGRWIKMEAVSRLIKDQRFVMVDDLLGDGGSRPWTAQRRSMNLTFGTDNCLLVGSRSEVGLTADEVGRIRDFVEQDA